MALLAGVEPTWRVDVVEETGSTNADLLAGVRRGTVGPYTALMARRQTAGRGRLDRSWQTLPDVGLALSAVLPLPAPPERWGLIPLMTGLALVEVVDALGAVAQLKWPNDVVMAGGKLAGILVEASPPLAVVGIGLNLAGTADDLGGAERVSLAMAGIVATPESAAAALLARLGSAVARPDLAAYRRHCLTLGQRVRAIRSPGDVVEGIALTVAETGALVIDTGQGPPVTVAAGDIHHLR